MHKKIFIPVFVLAFTVLACALNPAATVAPTNVPPAVQPTQPPVIQPTLPPVLQPTASNVLFSDDFSNPNSGWEIGDYSGGSVGYGSGYYFVKTIKTSINMYGMNSMNVQDVVIEVDAAQFDAPSNNNTGYGIICRLQTGDKADEGYYFRISGDGYYSVDVAVGGTFTSLLSGENWQAASPVIQGDSINHLVVTCNGTYLKFEVNGVTMYSGNDSTFSSGNIGLMGATYEDNSTAEFHYTNFVTSQP